MLTLPFDYASCVKISERISWKLDDVMPPAATIDLTLPLLPDSLASRGDLTFLRDEERLLLNHLASNAYLNLFQFVEEFILCTVVEHAQGELFGNHDAIRALVRFADEEVKHQELFKRFRVAFDHAFGHPAKVLENQAEVAQAVLSKSPIGVMLIILHIELMTQDHYTESVRGNQAIDPFFASLLEHHWLEESQHARIDALELEKLTSVASVAQLERGFDDYADLLRAMDGLLENQAQLDLETFEAVAGKPLPEADRERVVRAQHAGYRRTFLVAGLRSPQFVKWTGMLLSGRAPALAALASAWDT